MIKSSLVKVNEWFSKKVKAETCFLNLRSLFLEWIVLTEIVYSLKYLCIKLKMETSYVIGNVIAIKTENRFGISKFPVLYHFSDTVFLS